MVIVVVAAFPTLMVKDSGASVTALLVTLNKIQAVCSSVVKDNIVVIGTSGGKQLHHIMVTHYNYSIIITLNCITSYVLQGLH